MEYLTYKMALRLKERGLTYGGKVDAVITKVEKDGPPKPPAEAHDALDLAWAENGKVPADIDPAALKEAVKAALADLAAGK